MRKECKCKEGREWKKEEDGTGRQGHSLPLGQSWAWSDSWLLADLIGRRVGRKEGR
jgi:hypothetical protein